MVLVDTSVLIDFFRSKATKATNRLETIIDSECCITPIILQELLQGANNSKEFNLLSEFLMTQFFCYPTDPIVTYERAAHIFFAGRRKGITIRSTVDCLIAQIAIDNDIPLLHDDQDFLKIAKIAPLRIF